MILLFWGTTAAAPPPTPLVAPPKLAGVWSPTSGPRSPAAYVDDIVPILYALEYWYDR